MPFREHTSTFTKVTALAIDTLTMRAALVSAGPMIFKLHTVLYNMHINPLSYDTAQKKMP